VVVKFQAVWVRKSSFQAGILLTWKVGVGIGGTLKAKTGPYGELGPKVSLSFYGWDRVQPIPGASDAPLTSCGGLGGSFGVGANAGACTGNGKTGIKFGVSASPSGGGYGYLSIGAGKSWTWSIRDIWNSTIDLYNQIFGNNQDYYQLLSSDFISGGGGSGSWGDVGNWGWGLPPSQAEKLVNSSSW